MRLIGRRLGLYALTACVAITVNFLLPHFMPGNPIQTMIGKCKDRSRRKDQGHSAFFRRRVEPSLISQYFTYIGQLFHGNLGFSLTLGENVSTALKTSVPWTIGLIGVSTIISFLVALSAVRCWVGRVARGSTR